MTGRKQEKGGPKGPFGSFRAIPLAVSCLSGPPDRADRAEVQLLERVAGFSVLTEVEPFGFVFLAHSQTHGRIQDLEEDVRHHE